ncbi:MAG TPA: hypothetical protein VFZ53_33070 [Polyangiaceae bacterium]
MILASSSRGKRSVLATMLLASVLLSPPALADDAARSAELRTAARALAVEGGEAFDRGDYPLALDRFTRAESLFKAPTIQVMRARTLEKLGRLVEALDIYEATQRTPLAPDAPEAYRQAIVDARVDGNALANRVPRMTLHVVGPSAPPSDLVVTVDGRELPHALLDVERPVDPGPHGIVVHAKGYESATHSLVVAEGSRHVLEIPLVAEGAARSSAVLADNPPAAAENDGPATPSRRVAGFALAGAGGALLVTSAVTGMLALSAKSDLDDHCEPGCPETMTDELDAFRRNRTLSYVTLGLGAASLGAGGYLVLSTPSGSASAEVGLGLGSVRVRGRF